MYINFFNIKYKIMHITFVKLQKYTSIYFCKLHRWPFSYYKCKSRKIASKRLSRSLTTWRSRLQQKSLSGDFLRWSCGRR